MTRPLGILIKFTVFAVVMAVLTVFMFLVFGQVNTVAAKGYSAVFSDVSRLTAGNTVRVAGVRVGTVEDVSLQADGAVVVTFNADRKIVVTTGTRAEIRYLNLIGDRYLELVDSPGAAKVLPAGSQIPKDRTAPALDLDLLLGGLKPVIEGLNPHDVNALTTSLIQVLQGQGGTLQSLLSKSSSFTNAIADKNQVVEQLIDELRTVLGTLSKDGDEFAGTINKLEKLLSGLAKDRDPIGAAIESLNSGTASLSDLLGQARSPLAGTIEQLNRFAANVDGDKDRIDSTLGRLPEIYRKLARVGAYGGFFPYYLCGLTIRASDLEGHTVVFPFFKQETGRCAED